MEEAILITNISHICNSNVICTTPTIEVSLEGNVDWTGVVCVAATIPPAPEDGSVDIFGRGNKGFITFKRNTQSIITLFFSSIRGTIPLYSRMPDTIVCCIVFKALVFRITCNNIPTPLLAIPVTYLITITRFTRCCRKDSQYSRIKIGFRSSAKWEYGENSMVDWSTISATITTTPHSSKDGTFPLCRDNTSNYLYIEREKGSKVVVTLHSSNGMVQLTTRKGYLHYTVVNNTITYTTSCPHDHTILVPDNSICVTGLEYTKRDTNIMAVLKFVVPKGVVVCPKVESIPPHPQDGYMLTNKTNGKIWFTLLRPKDTKIRVSFLSNSILQPTTMDLNKNVSHRAIVDDKILVCTL